MLGYPLGIAFLLFVVTASSTSGAEAPILTPSELNAHTDEYDGRFVRVRGWLVLQFEDVGLWDSKEAHDAPHEGGDMAAQQELEGRSLAWPLACVSVTGAFMHNVSKFVSRPAVVEGIFRKRIFPPNVISNEICNDTGLEVTKISEPNL